MKRLLRTAGQGGEGYFAWATPASAWAGKVVKCQALFWREDIDLHCHRSSFFASLPSFLLLKDKHCLSAR